MNDIIKQKVNSITLKAYITFLKSNPDYVLLYNDKGWDTLPNYTIKPVQELLPSEKPILNLLDIHIDSFDIYHKKLSHPYKNKENHCDIFIWDSIQKEFYLYWKYCFDSKDLSNFYTVSPRIIQLHNSLSFLKHNNQMEDFYQQFISVKYPLMFLQTIREFANTLELLHGSVIDNEKRDKMLFTYCCNNKLLFKRIECQNILYEFVKQYQLTNNFTPYYADINKNESKDLFNIAPSLSLYINKKDAFSKYYNGELQSKDKLNTIFLHTVEWLNKKDTAPELGIKNIYIENIIEPNKEYNILISLNNEITHVEIIQVLDYLIYHLAHNKKASDYLNLLPKFYFNYVLQKKIPQKTSETNPKVKKI